LDADSVSAARLRARINEIQAELLRLDDPDLKLRHLQAALREIPDFGEACETILLSTKESLQVADNALKRKYQQRQDDRIFYFSVAAFVIAIIYSLFVPNPTPFQFYVLKAVLSCAVAAIVGFLPGFLKVHGVAKDLPVLDRLEIRAAGACAAFIIVWFASDKLFRR
jgi:hypothetical protein